jgi:predicted AlkP superfamily pyrophosphatase or phosphodiesterase
MDGTPRGRRRAALVICDGLRRDFIGPELTPNLHALRVANRSFDNHRSVFPSVTRSSSASIATGCHPARHGLHGNTMALYEDGTLAVHNVGESGFVERLRRVRGRTLRTPTLAERLRHDGGAIVFSNVSPGAAHFQDPDGHGHVYHRTGSLGPGRNAVPADDRLVVTHDAAGDRAMTERFCDEVLRNRRPALAVMWLCEPDHTQHETQLGSPAHLEVIRAADRCIGEVVAAVEALRAQGEELLLLVGSDHGHETTRRVIPVERLLYEAGFKRALDSDDIVLASQGTSALLYFNDDATGRVADVAGFLRAQDWAGEVLVDEALAHVGLRAEHGLRIALSMAKADGPNEHGVAGISDIATRFEANPAKVGLGQHGGLGTFEQQPFLIASGGGFRAQSRMSEPSAIVDIAPTILRYLGLPAEGMDGRALAFG